MVSALEGLRGNTTFSRMQAAALLAGIGPTADEPLRAEIAKALELMLTQPRDELREPTAAVHPR